MASSKSKVNNVAIFGNMASGKSSIASALVDSGYAQLAFAGPLKAISELAYGRIDKSGNYSVTGLDGSTKMVSGREILQGVGQAIKSHDRDFWLRCFFGAAKNYLDTPLVVDDGRFAFERESLSARGWLIVGIDTPLRVRRERYRTVYGRYPTQVEVEHQSEVELPMIIAGADLILSGEDDPYQNVRYIQQYAHRDI